MKSKCKNCIYRDLKLSSSNCDDCVRFTNHNLKQLNRSVCTVLRDLYNISLKMSVRGSKDEHIIVLPSNYFFNIYDTFAITVRDVYDLDNEIKDFDLQIISSLFNVKGLYINEEKSETKEK